MNSETLHNAILPIVFGLAQGACIGIALATSPLIGGVAVAGVVYNIVRTYYNG